MHEHQRLSLLCLTFIISMSTASSCGGGDTALFDDRTTTTNPVAGHGGSGGANAGGTTFHAGGSGQGGTATGIGGANVGGQAPTGGTGGSGGIIAQGGSGTGGHGGQTATGGAGQGGSPATDAGPPMIGKCDVSPPPAGTIRVCYTADTNVHNAAKTGPFVLHYQIKENGLVITDCFNAESKPTCLASCIDANAGDDVLSCVLPVGSNKTMLTTVHQSPNGIWWGDISNDPLGGHGDVQGTFILVFQGGAKVLSKADTIGNTGHENDLTWPYRNAEVAIP